MSWVTWRQHRGQVLVTTGFVAVLGAVLLVPAVIVAVVVAGRFAEFALVRLSTLWSAAWLAVVPAAIGLVRGAPLLVGEYGRGTRRLALLVRLGELSGAVVLAGLAAGVLLTPGAALVPAAWWLYAFVLGTTAGVLVRRPSPAAAVTLAGFPAAVVAGRELPDQWAAAGILLWATTLLGGVLAHRVARRGAST